MQTPYGQECPFYYVDAHRRTAEREQCHLLDGTIDAAEWTSELCGNCPVPRIKQANRCPNMRLQARIRWTHPWTRWQFWRPKSARSRMVVHATCTESGGMVSDPMVGCGRCHTPLEFVVGQIPPDAGENPKERTE